MTADKVDRRGFLQAIVVGLGTAGVLRGGEAALQGEATKKPNIIFFMTDQASAKWELGSAAKAYSHPSLDELRARGVTFSRMFPSNPVCCPSRATLSTGLTTRGHGVLQNGYELDPSLPTLMRLLQKAGWRTGLFGKLHHHAQFHGVHPDYHPYGFDVTYNTEDARAGDWLDWVQREYPQQYRAALATIWGTAIPELEAYGPQKVNLSEQIKEIRKTFKWGTNEFPHNNPRYYTLPFPTNVSQTEWITQHAIEFIRQTDSSQPLYAHISYVQPHSPSSPPSSCMNDVDDSQIPAPVPIEWVGDPLHPRCFPRTEGVHTEIPADWKLLRHYYFADLVSLDHQLARIKAALRETARLENTYIIKVSDHGELLLDHGFTGKGERHYDACVRIPLIISGPGLLRGYVQEEIVQMEDIFPTVMEMAGLPLPEPVVMGPFLKMPEAAERYPGASLLGLCRHGQPNHWRDEVYIESYNNIDSTTPEYWARTIRTKDWRYTMYPGSQGEQLFSLRDDPDEQNNLAGDPARAGIRQQMRDRLFEKVILEDYPHTRRDLYSLGLF